MNLRVPLRLTQRPVQGVYPLHPPVANQRLSRLYGANTRAEGVVIVSSYLSNDLIRVVTLHATVMASGSLTYLVGRGIASDDSDQVSTSHIKQVQIYRTLFLETTISC